MQTLPDTTTVSRAAADTLTFFGQIHQTSATVCESIGLSGPVWPIVLLVAGGLVAFGLIRSILRF
jgi:hypothetical protein